MGFPLDKPTDLRAPGRRAAKGEIIALTGG